MCRKIFSIFLAMLLIASVAISIPQASAHFTLGEQSSNGPTANMGGLPYPYLGVYQYGRYSAGTVGGHVIGHMAYVTPGLEYVPLRLQANYYSPNGSVLVNTSGDLKFYINVSAGVTFSPTPTMSHLINISNCASMFLYIAIPPEFSPSKNWAAKPWKDGQTINRADGDASDVSTTITNDYRYIEVGKFRSDHQIAPDWWFIRISAPNTNFPSSVLPQLQAWAGPNRGTAASTSSAYLYPAGYDPWVDRQIRGGPFDGCYEVTVNNIKSPNCSGKYFFKVFYTKQVDQPYIGGYVETYTSFDPDNYPVLLVKGEVDPGYISGTLRYCGHSTYYYGYYYGSPITGVAGKVTAVGTALDPVTNEPIDREVCGVGYFNSSANGYYEIEGLAPGVYTLTAWASGFIPTTLDTKITVKRGQSIKGVDICLRPGPKLTVKVFSKCPTGYIEWPEYVEMFTEPAKDYTVLGGRLLRERYTPSTLHTFTPAHQAPIYIKIMDVGGNTINEHYTTFTRIGSNTGEILIGDPACYSGIPSGYDGHVPQVNATYTSGVEPGTYNIRAYVFGYVQVSDYSVTLPGTEFSGTSYMEMDLMKGGTVDVTVHFHDTEMPSDDRSISSARYLVIQARDSNNIVRAFNITLVPAGNQTHRFTLIGDSNYWMSDGRIYGMPEDTYTFRVYMKGYVQQEFPMHTVSLCSASDFSLHLIKGATINTTIYSRDWQNPSMSRTWRYPDNRIKIIVYNSDGGYVLDTWTSQSSGTDSVSFSFDGRSESPMKYYKEGARPSGIHPGLYTMKAFTVGYIQKEIPEVYVTKGSTADIPLYLYCGAKITVVVDYKIEELPASLPIDKWSYYIRIKAFDEEGNLIAANITAIPQASQWTVSQWPWSGSLNPAQPSGVQTWVFELSGFNRFTTPVNTLSNCPTDTYGYIPGDEDGPRTVTLPYGIPPGSYSIEVSGPSGYIQLLTITATVTWCGETTVVFELDKGASISGFVWTKNWMNDYRAASWIKISATSGSGDKSTESRDGVYSISGLKPDTWTVTSELTPPGGDAGYVSESMTVTTTWGAGAGGNTFYLEESGIPIPEFPTAILALISALAASLFLMRWRRSPIVLGK